MEQKSMSKESKSPLRLGGAEKSRVSYFHQHLTIDCCLIRQGCCRGKQAPLYYIRRPPSADQTALDLLGVGLLRASLAPDRTTYSATGCTGKRYACPHAFSPAKVRAIDRQQCLPDPEPAPESASFAASTACPKLELKTLTPAACTAAHGAVADSFFGFPRRWEP